MLDNLQAAVYATDADGVITYYNEIAAALWGRRPIIGETRWTGAYRLHYPDGEPMALDDSPLARVVREQRPLLGVEIVTEKPNGALAPVLAYPTPLFDAQGAFIGAVTLQIDITERKRAEDAALHLASIVESSDDAILTKDLNGIITSWNAGATRLFGYSPEEAVGRPITLLIPEDRLDEEPLILERIRNGQRVQHFETIRRRKDGSLVEISLTISPVKTPSGRIIGASKIARDITERRRAEAQQNLLVREMSHRIKNLFALAGGVVALSAHSAKSVQELNSAVRMRLAALARAHGLILSGVDQEEGPAQATASLHEVIRAITAPYEPSDGPPVRFEIKGPDLALNRTATTSFALLLHEFTTNAAKYGALSTPEGRVVIECAEGDDQVCIDWRELGGPRLSKAKGEDGFGSQLVALTTRQLGGEVVHEWRAEGLAIRMTAERGRLLS
ncbi:PAS domain S-box protein [Phenylobacterium montanum]|uniref:histidine kinase n=1 Tax=Phenylobacterium montanum TaxID=2823693 RepID=A0A975IVY4_9CAUL|nr:PAS domain S-box protein [Caulobacter sp. S6]QUD89265.1 PAS domain S-box protein [Caulobacter sp. S6]